jgi:hypothetical protein
MQLMENGFCLLTGSGYNIIRIMTLADCFSCVNFKHYKYNRLFTKVSILTSSNHSVSHLGCEENALTTRSKFHGHLSPENIFALNTLSDFFAYAAPTCLLTELLVNQSI